MIKKIVLGLSILGVLFLLGLIITDFLYLDQKVNPDNSFLSPLVEKTEELTSRLNTPDTDLAEKDTFNILLLGIDRRSKFESAFRTDTMILVTMDTTNNRIVLSSIPRDLWYGGGRLNALYIQNGWEDVQTAFEEITGERPDRFVLTDFEDFSWIVDALGGVPVNVETTFTDYNYPVDATKTYQTVSFTKGNELMSGERALIFARSRKGDNDNGDWGRMKRQHLLLKGIVGAVTQPTSFVCDLTKKSVFSTNNESCESNINKEVIMKAFGTVTTGKMDTNFEIGDLVYLWDFYKDKDEYLVDSLLMDYAFLYTPPMEQYGGAWVLASVNGSYNEFHTALSNKLAGIEEVEPLVEDSEAEGAKAELPQNAETQTFDEP